MKQCTGIRRRLTELVSFSRNGKVLPLPWLTLANAYLHSVELHGERRAVLRFGDFMPAGDFGPLRHSVSSTNDLNESNARLWNLCFKSTKNASVPYIPVHTYVDVRVSPPA